MVGITATGSLDDTRPGFHAGADLAFGFASADDTVTSFLLGVAALWSVHRRFGVRAGIGWERFPGLNSLVMARFGIRLGF